MGKEDRRQRQEDWEFKAILCYSKFKASLGYLIPDLRKKSRPRGAGVFSALR